jgi:enoyl-CoA hydratase
MSDQPATEQRVTVERDGAVLLIGLNRPAKRNAFDLEAIEQLAQAYARLGEDDDLRVGVLHAHGDHFSAGIDLRQLAPLLRESGPELLAGSGPYDPLGIWKPPVPKPVVMAVNGIAFTLSIELALACDVVVAADDVRFCQLEVARGIYPFEGGSFRAPLQLGWGNAMRFLLTAEEFGAEEALRIGLVQEVVPAGDHVDRARALARRIASRAPLAVRATLATARAARAAAETAAAEHTRRVLPELWRSDDATEGLASFVERRDAVFSGR